MNILYTEIKKCKKDNNSLLLIPRNVVYDRKFIYVLKLEYFLKLKCNKCK